MFWSKNFLKNLFYKNREKVYKIVIKEDFKKLQKSIIKRMKYGYSSDSCYISDIHTNYDISVQEYSLLALLYKNFLEKKGYTVKILSSGDMLRLKITWED
jgi:hypothetical protein